MLLSTVTWRTLSVGYRGTTVGKVCFELYAPPLMQFAINDILLQRR